MECWWRKYSEGLSCIKFMKRLQVDEHQINFISHRNIFELHALPVLLEVNAECCCFSVSEYKGEEVIGQKKERY